MTNRIDYLNSIAAYVLRWYVVDQTHYKARKVELVDYAKQVTGDMLDQLYAMITYARGHPQKFKYREETIEKKAGDKTKDVLKMLYSAGVDISDFMPYRIAYVGEHSRMTAEMVAEVLHATHVVNIEDAAEDSVELCIAISTMHQRVDRNIATMAPKIIQGGMFVIRENDVHTNRKDDKSVDFGATEFLDVMNMAMEIISAADSVEVPISCAARMPSDSDGAEHYIIKQGDYTVAKVPSQYVSFVKGSSNVVRVQYDFVGLDVIAANVADAKQVSWEAYKKYLVDSGMFTTNTYRNMKSWDRAFGKNGFETFAPITYEKFNPHKVFYKLYRKL